MSRSSVITRIAAIGKTLCLSVAVAASLMSTSPAARAGSDAWTTKTFGVVEMSLDECMYQAKRVLRQQGYSLVFHDDAVGGYRGAYSAQIKCGPRRVVFGVVVGPDVERTNGFVNELADQFLHG